LTPPRELHAAAWAAVEPLFHENRDRTLRALRGARRYRTYHRSSLRDRRGSLPRPGGDLAARPGDAPDGMDPTGAVEEAIAATLLHRGEVQLITEDSTSGPTLPAAILRH
jgi:hypothetical protein